jgi:uncharacterized membrane protein YccC
MRFLQTHNVKRNIISNKVVMSNQTQQTQTQTQMKKEEKRMDDALAQSAGAVNSILIPDPEPVITINISDTKNDAPRDDATLISDL